MFDCKHGIMVEKNPILQNCFLGYKTSSKKRLGMFDCFCSVGWTFFFLPLIRIDGVLLTFSVSRHSSSYNPTSGFREFFMQPRIHKRKRGVRKKEGVGSGGVRK